jgi:hypothetical protein
LPEVITSGLLVQGLLRGVLCHVFQSFPLINYALDNHQVNNSSKRDHLFAYSRRKGQLRPLTKHTFVTAAAESASSRPWHLNWCHSLLPAAGSTNEGNEGDGAWSVGDAFRCFPTVSLETCPNLELDAIHTTRCP